eukprot:1136878-Pelagomonas_calceolata.AAC.2
MDKKHALVRPTVSGVVSPKIRFISRIKVSLPACRSLICGDKMDARAQHLMQQLYLMQLFASTVTIIVTSPVSQASINIPCKSSHADHHAETTHRRKFLHHV